MTTQPAPTDAERVDATCELLTILERGLKSRSRYTVQVMPHGCEVIEAESGDLVKTIALTELEDV